MEILEIRRLNPQERGSTCEIITGRGSRCNYSARRVIVLDDGNGNQVKAKVCRIHLKSITSTSPYELVKMFSSNEVLR